VREAKTNKNRGRRGGARIRSRKNNDQSLPFLRVVEQGEKEKSMAIGAKGAK